MAGGEAGQLSIERARDARNLSLGAYYRLRPNLNTYHAALYETGAILVFGRASRRLAARAGARRGRRDRASPVRPIQRVCWGSSGTPSSSSATPRTGFLVLNSWGRDWGGWTPARRTPRRCRASRSGATTTGRTPSWTAGSCASVSGRRMRSTIPSATRGSGSGPRRRSASTPVHAILGNFLHLDDGDFVSSGAFVSTRRTLEETRRLLDEDAATSKPYRGVLLTFAGGLTGAQGRNRARCPLEASGARRRGGIPSPCSGASTTSIRRCTVLDGVFSEAQKRAGGPGPRLDQVVEEMAHGIGRALWRDIGRAAELSARARRAAARPRPRRRRRWRRAGPGFGLRIVAESEGAFAARGAAQRHADRGLRRRGRPVLRDARERRSRCATAERRRVRRTRHVSERRLGTGTAGAAHSGPPAERAGREAPGGAALRPLLLRAGAAGLPDGRGEDRGPGAAADRPSAAPQDRGRGGLGRLERRAADRARADRLAAGRQRRPARHRSRQIQLIYRSDVGGRLKAVLRRNPARTAPAAKR